LKRTKTGGSNRLCTTLGDDVAATDQTIRTETTHDLEESEKRWPAWMAFLTAWLLPATTATRTGAVSLKKAYAVHIIAALLTVILLFALVAVTNMPSNVTITLSGLKHEFGDVCHDIVREFKRNSKEIIFIMMSFALSIELGFVILALLLTPWGAGDEPVRSSIAHALRVTWLQTTHDLPLLLLIGLLTVPCGRASMRYWQNNPTRNIAYPTRPQKPKNQTPDSPAMQEYQIAMKKYQQQQNNYNKAWTKYYNNRPWYLKYDYIIIGFPCLALSLWIVWAFFRAVGCNRKIKPIARPPTCEQCGYNLIATPMESRCPECGEPVVQSLGPDARPGTCWQKRQEVGWWRAWWQSHKEALIRPKQFGRQIQLQSHQTDHRLFLIIHLVSVFFIWAIGVMCCYYADSGRNPLKDDEMILIAPFTGIIAATIQLSIVMIASWTSSINYRLQEKRNLLNGSTKTACYLSGYLVLWALLSVIMAVAVTALEGLFDCLADMINIYTDEEVLMFLTWLIPNFLAMLVYLLLVSRTTASVRYANR